MALSWALLLLRPLFEKLLLGWYLCWAIPIHWRHSQRLHLWREFFSKLNYNILWVVCWIEIGFSYAPTHFWHFLKNCPTINIDSKWLKFSENTVDDLNYKSNIFQNSMGIFYGSFVVLKLASRKRQCPLFFRQLAQFNICWNWLKLSENIVKDVIFIWNLRRRSISLNWSLFLDLNWMFAISAIVAFTMAKAREYFCME